MVKNLKIFQLEFLLLLFLLPLATANAQPLKVVMFGRSLTAGGNWQNYFPGVGVYNLGKSDDTIDNLLSRLEQVSALKSAQIYLLIGINNFARQANIEKILEKHYSLRLALTEQRPQAHLYVISLLPVSETHYPGWNRAINKINSRLAHPALVENYTYIDIFPLVVDEDGSLRAEYSFDGLHLRPSAYQVWASALVPYMNEATKNKAA